MSQLAPLHARNALFHCIKTTNLCEIFTISILTLLVFESCSRGKLAMALVRSNFPYSIKSIFILKKFFILVLFADNFVHVTSPDQFT